MSSLVCPLACPLRKVRTENKKRLFASHTKPLENAFYYYYYYYFIFLPLLNRPKKK